MGISSFTDNWPLQEHKVLFGAINEKTQISVFANELHVRSSKDLPKIWRAAIDSFKQMIIKRSNYLDKLPLLTEGWISGQGKAPMTSSTDTAKSLLSFISNKAEDLQRLPKIVMGPLPSGGVAIELHLDHDNVLFISICDDGKIDLDVEKNGYFFETVTSRQNLLSNVIEKYGAISR
jgi:hypothetical protein